LLELLELYKSYCTKCFEGSVALDKEYEWIPGKIARYCNDKEYVAHFIFQCTGIDFDGTLEYFIP